MSWEVLNKMSSLIRLQDLNFNLFKRMYKRWFHHETNDVLRKDDPLAERPENWYQGPLILLEETEEGTLREFTTTQI